MSRRIATAAWLVLFATGAGYVLGFRHGNGYWQDDAQSCETPVLQLAGTLHR